MTQASGRRSSTRLAVAMAIAMLVPAVRLPADDRVRRFAIRLLALHLVFGIVKVAGYDEPEAAVFMGFDLAVIALLVRLGRRSASRRPRPADRAAGRSGAS